MNSLGHRLDAISPDDLEELLVRLNRGRCVTRENCDTAELESYVEENFHSSERLAVYGSLAPGRENHTKIEHLGGTWQAGHVFGELVNVGWGTTLGYPAFRWDPKGKQIEVRLLVSSSLSAYWRELDRFEGSEYVRILVPVYHESGLLGVANIYALE